MPKRDMNDLLKKRMSATQQAAEIVVGDEAYETLFRGAPAPEASRFCDLPIERLRPFFTADIGFRPYPPEKLKAFSQQLAEQGIYERVIVRPISGSNDYEILAGHNRTKAWQMSGHDMIPAEVVSADDARAVSIAVATNLLRRQDLSPAHRDYPGWCRPVCRSTPPHRPVSCHGSVLHRTSMCCAAGCLSGKRHAPENSMSQRAGTSKAGPYPRPDRWRRPDG